MSSSEDEEPAYTGNAWEDTKDIHSLYVPVVKKRTKPPCLVHGGGGAATEMKEAIQSLQACGVFPKRPDFVDELSVCTCNQPRKSWFVSDTGNNQATGLEAEMEETFTTTGNILNSMIKDIGETRLKLTQLLQECKTYRDNGRYAVLRALINYNTLPYKRTFSLDLTVEDLVVLFGWNGGHRWEMCEKYCCQIHLYLDMQLGFNGGKIGFLVEAGTKGDFDEVMKACLKQAKGVYQESTLPGSTTEETTQTATVEPCEKTSQEDLSNSTPNGDPFESLAEQVMQEEATQTTVDVAKSSAEQVMEDPTLATTEDCSGNPTSNGDKTWSDSSQNQSVGQPPPADVISDETDTNL